MTTATATATATAKPLSQKGTSHLPLKFGVLDKIWRGPTVVQVIMGHKQQVNGFGIHIVEVGQRIESATIKSEGLKCAK